MINIKKILINIKNNIISLNYKYYIYILLLIIVFIYIIYLYLEEQKYDIILPYKYIFHNNNNKYDNNNNDIFFTMNNYSDDILSSIDLRSRCPPVYDQGSLGLCHINATCFLYRYICLNNNIDFNPSRMFCEYNILHLNYGYLDKISIKNKIYDLQGSNIINDINTLLLYGTCEEKDCPYPSEENINYNNKIINEIHDLKDNIHSEQDILDISDKYKNLKINIPNKNNYINAKNHKILEVLKLYNNVNEIKKYLHYHGPVLFAFQHGHIINNILLNRTNIETYKLILKKEINLNDSEKKKINNDINILNKYNNKIEFNSYYDELRNIKNSKNINNLFNKYSKEYRKEINQNCLKNSNINDLTLKFPNKLISESEKYCKEIGIDLENFKNNLNYFNEINIQNDYLNNFGDYTMNKLNKLKNTKKGKDVYDFINLFTPFNNDSGHVMTIVGYNDNNNSFIIANSWSNNWGDNGYFYMDYEYFNNKDNLWGYQTRDIYCIHNTTDGHI